MTAYVTAVAEAKDSLHAVVAEVKRVFTAVQGGLLVTRGDARAFSGGFGEVIDGMNKMLDAVSTPVHEALTVLGSVADHPSRYRCTATTRVTSRT